MENRDWEIICMSINMHTISTLVNISVYTSIEDIEATAQEDAGLQKLKTYIIQGWPHKKDKVECSIEHFMPIRSQLAMISGIAMKGRRIIPFLLQRQILEKLFSNNMDIKKMRLLVMGLVYLMIMNADIENTIKWCASCLEYQ